jgi:hypothetical protein
VVHKLLLTGVLTFVSPGTPAQISFGMFELFAYLCVCLVNHPYRNKTHRQIAICSPLLLFLLLAFTLMLSVKVQLTSNDATFYSAIFGALVVGIVVGPFMSVVRRLTKMSAGHDFEVEEDEEHVQAAGPKSGLESGDVNLSSNYTDHSQFVPTALDDHNGHCA